VFGGERPYCACVTPYPFSSLQVGGSLRGTSLLCRIGSGEINNIFLVLAGLKSSRPPSVAPVDQGSPVPAWSAKVKRYFFWAFHISFFGPERADHARTEKREFGRFPFLTEVLFCLCVYSILEGSVSFRILFYQIYIFAF
jgi:hypothetical protein